MASKIAILLLVINVFIYQKISALLAPHTFISRRYNLPSWHRQLLSTLQETKCKSKRGGHSCHISTSRLLCTINSYDEAMSIIDKCSTSSQPRDELYNAVRYIDKNAKDIYPNLETKEEMWSRGYGSWKLVLATGGGKFTAFKPVPIFAYARIDESTFGNGVGVNENVILLSLLGPLDFDAKKRQMKICIDDMFIFSKKITNALPDFAANGVNLKKRPNDFSGKKGDRIPAFTFIASSDKSLIARGGTGGIAIWTRLEKDIIDAAYGSETVTSQYSL